MLPANIGDTNSSPNPTAVINHIILFSTRCKSASKWIKGNAGNRLFIYFGTQSLFGSFRNLECKRGFRDELDREDFLKTLGAACENIGGLRR